MAPTRSVAHSGLRRAPREGYPSIGLTRAWVRSPFGTKRVGGTPRRTTPKTYARPYSVLPRSSLNHDSSGRGGVPASRREAGRLVDGDPRFGRRVGERYSIPKLAQRTRRTGRMDWGWAFPTWGDRTRIPMRVRGPSPALRLDGAYQPGSEFGAFSTQACPLAHTIGTRLSYAF